MPVSFYFLIILGDLFIQHRCILHIFQGVFNSFFFAEWFAMQAGESTGNGVCEN